MKVTKKKEMKHSQNQNGSLPQKDSAEHEGYAGECRTLRTTENNITKADRLLEQILDRTNLNKAYKRVKSNKGAAGIDKMSVDKLYEYLAQNGKGIKQKIMEGKYKPNPVRRVEIPKENGKKRPLGIPTVVDRVIQQAIVQVLSPIYERQFSDNSYGFRPNRNAHKAIRKCQENIEEGYKFVVDMDLEKFFDTVNQSKLIEVLSRTIKDGRVVSLVHKYLRSGVVIKHSYKETAEGVPQGGPLSPLLSNIMLNELDKKLEERGHRFVRYADDVMIFCRSRKSAERTFQNILSFIEKKLFLRVNVEKTVVDYVDGMKFLGIMYYHKKKEILTVVHPKTVEKMKNKIRELTARSNGWSNEKRIQKLKEYIRGWVNYFKVARIETLLKKIDGWMRRRIRMIYWKQWKKVKTRYEMLKRYGIDEQKSWEYANTRKGHWRISNSPILTRSLRTETLKKLGYISFYDYYQEQTA